MSMAVSVDSEFPRAYACGQIGSEDRGDLLIEDQTGHKVWPVIYAVHQFKRAFAHHNMDAWKRERIYRLWLRHVMKLI